MSVKLRSYASGTVDGESNPFFKNMFTSVTMQNNCGGQKGSKDVCLFIVLLYVKPWLECTVVTKAPNQDLRFLKMLKEYEKVDATISKASISKFSNHLWYLCEETE